jgi:sugar (pentulose or hexulose) kinase
MTPYLGEESTPINHNGNAQQPNALLSGTRTALQQLLAKAKEQLPAESLAHIANVKFSTANHTSLPLSSRRKPFQL